MKVNSVSRSKGHSATAAAAYRAGGVIRDQICGETHDYSRKSGVIHSEIIGSPLDRDELWNSAEQAETNKNGSVKQNARVARELVISLPYEAGKDQQIEATRNIAKHLNQTYGVAVDFAVHSAGKGGDQRNTHAHILFTTREIQDGGSSLGKKTRILDDRKTGPEEVEKIRAKYSEIAQAIADDQNKWDNQSYEARGIDRQPQEHMGRSAMALERKGIQTTKGDRNRQIRDNNYEREMTRDEIADLEQELENQQERNQNDRQPGRTEQPEQRRTNQTIRRTSRKYEQRKSASRRRARRRRRRHAENVGAGARRRSNMVAWHMDRSAEHQQNHASSGRGRSEWSANSYRIRRGSRQSQRQGDGGRTRVSDDRQSGEREEPRSIEVIEAEQKDLLEKWLDDSVEMNDLEKEHKYAETPKKPIIPWPPAQRRWREEIKRIESLPDKIATKQKIVDETKKRIDALESELNKAKAREPAYEAGQEQGHPVRSPAQSIEQEQEPEHIDFGRDNDEEEQIKM